MLRIVIVDDAKEDLVLFERILHECKILNPVLSLTSGDELFSILESNHGNVARQEALLIFLDLVMAPRNGLEVLRRWQNSPGAEHSAVIMVSGLNNFKLINEGYQAGARTFLLKPVTRDDVLHVLNSLAGLVSVEKTDEGYLLVWSAHRADRGSLEENQPARAARSITLSA